MWITRRTALIAAGSLLLSRHTHAADSDNALFWTVTMPERQGAVLFGYERIAAAVAPEIINEGNAFVDGSQQTVIDMPANVRFPTITLAHEDAKPILQALSPRTAERLRKVLATTPAASTINRLPGLQASTLLMMEGQHNAAVTAGGTIVEHAQRAGKPVGQLLSDNDMQSAWQPPNIAAASANIGEDTISYMLDLRDQTGPIGGHLEQLYLQRKAEEIERVTPISTIMARSRFRACCKQTRYAA